MSLSKYECYAVLYKAYALRGFEAFYSREIDVDDPPKIGAIIKRMEREGLVKGKYTFHKLDGSNHCRRKKWRILPTAMPILNRYCEQEGLTFPIPGSV